MTMDQQSTSTDRQMIGTVARWMKNKGFGFLKLDDESSPDVFCHISQLKAAGIEADPSPGQRYYFDIAEVRPGRYQAVNLRIEREVDEVV